MCLAELIDILRTDGYDVQTYHVHRAICSGDVPRPRLNGSLRYEYGDEQVEAMRRWLDARPARRAAANEQAALAT